MPKRELNEPKATLADRKLEASIEEIEAEDRKRMAEDYNEPPPGATHEMVDGGEGERPDVKQMGKDAEHKKVKTPDPKKADELGDKQKAEKDLAKK